MFSNFTRPKQLTAAVVAMVLLATTQAIAIPSEHLNWGYILGASETACPAGKEIIKITHKVINGIDSGTSGNYWAYGDYVRHISVVPTGNDEYCATVKYQGSFDSVAGASPGCSNTGTCGNEGLSGGVVGTFQGGYTAIVTGTPIADPEYRTKGSIGILDYDCDASSGICASAFNWLDAYFEPGWGFSYQWWGWIYHAGNNGSWINAASGNSGDITGE